MSLLIKNMEMPKRGETITVTICDDGLVFEEYYKGIFNAVSLPIHGDLISKEYAIATACSGLIRTFPTTENGEDWIRVKEVRESLKNAPTVIPAEKERKKHETAFRHTERV